MADRPSVVHEKNTPGEGRTGRIARVLARAGLCSRREAERFIAEGRVSVNGTVLNSPALNVGARDAITLDGISLPRIEPVRLWRYYKPRGLVTTHHDPEGRKTVFDALPPTLPRVISIGRLDVNTEGLLLLTNDGDLARKLELPATGWTRRYRVRAYGRTTQSALDTLQQGVTVEGIRYGPVQATLEQGGGANVWITVKLTEGKNREVKRVLAFLGLRVNRLLRLSYGPFQLTELQEGEIREVPPRILRSQLGERVSGVPHEEASPSGKDKKTAKPRKGRQKKARHSGKSTTTRTPTTRQGTQPPKGRKR